MLVAGGALHELTSDSSNRVKKNPEENRKIAHAAAVIKSVEARQDARMPGRQTRGADGRADDARMC
jgi:hypothetical protein